MESHKCRFCSKSFVNGRVLGSHMSVHEFSVDEEEKQPSQLSDETASYVSSSSFEDEDVKRKGFKENPTMDDPKFALTDGESETESSRKRTRKLESLTTKKKNRKTSQLGFKTETDLENHPQSSVSDTTTEEDLAFCLMMLSRDKWKKKKTKGRHKCETCGKVFKSYQALGGHRASHKKNRVSKKTEQRNETEYDDVVVVTEKRIHECPICFRVFASGQALGGHKRSHGIGSLSVNHHHQEVNGIESVKQRMIDLNLPAPTDEEDISVVFQ